MAKNNKKDSNNLDSNPMDLSKLSKKAIIERAKKFSKQYCVGNGDGFKLKDYETKASFNLGEEGKPLVKETLEIGVNALAAMQDILYAQDKWSLLIIFQAMDAAGKDGAIKHVMSGINPQGCQVSSFKRRVRKNWTMIFCGVAKNICRNEDASAFLIALITKKSWWFGYMRRF